MDQQNKAIINYTMGYGKVNLYAMIMIIPTLIVFLLPYLLIWGYDSFTVGKDALMSYFFVLLIGGIIVHELLHGITWALFAKNGIKSIKFGFNLKFLTPYCHCKEPLKVKHYRLGGAMPLVVMGVLPALFGIAVGNGALLSFGIFFTWAAGGDIIALFMLRNLDAEVFISDHPTKMGFYREVDIKE